MKYSCIVITVFVVVFITMACQLFNVATPTPFPTYTPYPTYTPQPEPQALNEIDQPEGEPSFQAEYAGMHLCAGESNYASI